MSLFNNIEDKSKNYIANVDQDIMQMQIKIFFQIHHNNILFLLLLLILFEKFPNLFVFEDDKKRNHVSKEFFFKGRTNQKELVWFQIFSII